MILGIGIDLCEIRRVREAIERTGEPFMKKFLTQKEMDLAPKTGAIALYVATRFAAKEAIFKAFSIGFSKFEATDIEIGVGELGEPTVLLSGNLAKFAAQRGVKKVLVSISSDGQYATAISLLEYEVSK